MCFTLKNKDYMIKYSVDAKWKHKNFLDTRNISALNVIIPHVFGESNTRKNLANWF